MPPLGPSARKLHVSFNDADHSSLKESEIEPELILAMLFCHILDEQQGLLAWV